MANILNQRVSAELAQAALTQIKSHLNDITALMPFLIGLTVAERIELPKIGVANKNFVEAVLTMANNNPHLVPSFVDMEEVRKDLSLFRQLDEILSITDQLQEKMRDTQMLAGSEAYSSALMAYRLVQMAAESGVPGADSAYDSLRQRFAGQGAQNNAPSEPTTPEPDK